MIDAVKKEFPDLRIPVVDGGLQLVYEPDPNRPNAWMVNDHCLIQDEDGLIHYFGIENPFPTTTQALEWLEESLRPSERPFIQTMHQLMHGYLYRPGTHFRVGHAVARDIWGPWSRLPAAFDGEESGHAYGSPFVVRDSAQYRAFGPGMGGDYVSSDLHSWVPSSDKTVWVEKGRLGFENYRDPCIIQLADGTYLQYFAAADPHGRHTVAVASSPDLRIWHREEPCYVEELPPGTPDWFGIFESPFVLRREDLYYLFVGFSHRHYNETFVVVSRNPRSFTPRHKVTTLFTHAAELIDVDGETYMSSCGIEDPQWLNRSGLWMCKIKWLTP
ncbi:MAG: hypothetical protein HY320_00365 [Armatimonadetes bacterium]|nr:hypothetical protein [Armatimonadota bacterium]